MFLRILKKDLMKRKAINGILFLFITLATVFLASSVQNILSVSQGVSYYMDYANVPDIDFVISSSEELDKIASWMEVQKKDGVISDYDRDDFYTTGDEAFKVIRNGKEESIDSKGADLYIGKEAKSYDKVYDLNGDPFTLKKGEIAVANVLMRDNDLKIGDTIIIESGGIRKQFTIAVRTKDAALGSDMGGMLRIILHEDDQKEFMGSMKSFSLIHVMCDQPNDFTQDLNKQGFSSLASTVTRDMFAMMYSFDMIIAGLLIAIGICLIFIALLVLRFTLVFTLEEQYREIGILKAIGLRDRGIQHLYLIKYLCIVTIGAALGLVLSIPVSSALIKSVSANMIMDQEGAGILVNILCALVIILLVLGFCQLCTRRLRKISAIQAIRNGDSGERFRKRLLSLYRRPRLNVSMFLGINDITTHLKRYVVLIITFCVSFLLITIPLNTVKTMNSDDMVKRFMMDPDSAVLMKSLDQEGEEAIVNSKNLLSHMEKLKQELKEHGYDAKLSATPIFFLSLSGENKKSANIMSVQVLGEQTDFAVYAEGVAPKLENEIAVSKDVLKENDWKIGDTLTVRVNGKKRKLLITGSYTDYMQLGKSIRLNPMINMEQEVMFTHMSVMVYIDSDKTQEEMAEQLQKDLPHYAWTSAQELVDVNIGGIKGVLSDMLLPMTAMLCAVIMLITLLMEKLLITREKGEIAMMKSIGFNNAAICKWQMMRMFSVVITSMIIAIPLSLVSNQLILKPIFKIMGAEMSIITDPLQAYLLYPLMLLTGILAATMISALSIRRIDIRELNNVE